MALTPGQAVDQVKTMIDVRGSEQARLELLRLYLRDEQRLTWLPQGTPVEVQRIARMSRVNVLPFIVSASVQALYVDHYRTHDDVEEQPAWDLWRANRLKARQVGVHRSAMSYGAAYTTVLPGDPIPVIRGASPRKMTTLYADGDDWPMWALEKRSTARGEMWRLFDQELTYWVGVEPGEDRPTFITDEGHGAGVVPVVRYLPTDDLDDPVQGDVEPLLRLQDQINLTTFSLLVAQHYGAHRQRYIIGWLAESEEQALKASAQKLWTFDEDPNNMKIGEFEQTELAGYIESREASLRHLATISQTPVHELLGQLANLSAEALAAARDSHNRKLEERKTMLGESHEQTLELAGYLAGYDIDPTAWVRWRDMEARSLAQTADALGKLVQMLGVPPEALWERVPGVTQDEVQSWKAMAADGGELGNLAEMLQRQMGTGPAF
ncbi:MAG: phage portal protein [Nitriliruptoraceae bacterium]